MLKKTYDSLLSELFTEYKQIMFKIALGILQNNAYAEDAVQETFLHISNNLKRVSKIPADDRVRYVTEIVKNVCYDQIRSKNRRQVFACLQNMGTQNVEKSSEESPRARIVAS